MEQQLQDMINFDNGYLDNNGILVVKNSYASEASASKKAWERIYDFDLAKIRLDRADFDANKLEDHISYLKKYYHFNDQTKYLEIGCGPAHIGEYVMKNFNSYFIGVDFNYNILLTLKRYFDQKGYKKYLLINSDINQIPLKSNSIDFIYGGGVIEHFPDTRITLRESYRILKGGGVSFNTVPAFNLWWLLRFYNNIPAVGIFKKVFEFIHEKIFRNKILENNYGYELSYSKSILRKIHQECGFHNIIIEAFAFHPSHHRLNNKILRDLYFQIQKHELTTAIYLVVAGKN